MAEENDKRRENDKPEDPTPAPDAEPVREGPGAPAGEPPAAARGETRALRRTRDDRMIAGVCGGLARYFGLHPAIYRIGFVALALAGGVGILLYAVAALVIPVEGADESLAEEKLRANRDRPALLVALGLLAFLAIFFFSQAHFWFWPAAGPFWFLLLVVASALVLWQVSERDRRVPAVAGTGATGGAQVGPPEPQRPSMFLPGLGALLAAAGVLGLLDALDVLEIPAGAAVAGGLVLAGLFVALGVFWRGASGLAAVGILVALCFAAFAAAEDHLRGGFGERSVRPLTIGQLDDEYRHGAGRLELDLRDLDLPPGETRLAARVGAGELVILVPDDVAVAATGEASMGSVGVLGQREDGFDVHERAVVGDFDDGPTRLVLEAEVGVGEIHVARVGELDFDFDEDRWGP